HGGEPSLRPSVRKTAWRRFLKRSSGDSAVLTGWPRPLTSSVARGLLASGHGSPQRRAPSGSGARGGARVLLGAPRRALLPQKGRRRLEPAEGPRRRG